MIITNEVNNFLTEIIIDSIKSLDFKYSELFFEDLNVDDFNYNIEELSEHIYEVTKKMYDCYFEKSIGKFHIHYIYQLIYKVIYDNREKEWFKNLNSFKWKDDYYKFDFHFEPQKDEYKLNRVTILNNKPKQEQGTQEWLNIRKTCLTASNITHIINNRNLNSIILNKCGYDKLPFVAGDAINHGKKYEDVAVLVYENRTGIKVYADYGCIPHEDFNFIGASPDGIDEKGNVIEIKCVYSRIITGLPKEDYYDQMQLQMEVFKLSKCLFLECEIKEYFNFDDYKLDTYIDEKTGEKDETKTKDNLEKGAIIRIITKNPKNSFKYIYPENLKMNHKQIKKWVKKNIKKLKKDDPEKKTYYECEALYWKLTNYSCINIYKDNNWIKRNIGNFYDFWNKINYYRNNIDEYNNLIKKFEERRKISKQHEEMEVLTQYLLGNSSSDED